MVLPADTIPFQERVSLDGTFALIPSGPNFLVIFHKILICWFHHYRYWLDTYAISGKQPAYHDSLFVNCFAISIDSVLGHELLLKWTNVSADEPAKRPGLFCSFVFASIFNVKEDGLVAAVRVGLTHPLLQFSNPLTIEILIYLCWYIKFVMANCAQCGGRTHDPD